MSHSRLTAPSMTNETRQVANRSRPAMIGGVTALPIRAKECTNPWANPQLPCGVQLAIARVAVGKPAPSPNPSASRSIMSVAIPVTAPVSAVDIPTIAQQIASVSRGPSRSPIQPPTNWKKAYGIAKAENASPSWVLLILRSAFISGAAVEILTRSTKYRKYIAHSSARTRVGTPSLLIRMDLPNRRRGRRAYLFRPGAQFTLDLCPMQDAARVGVERIAAMHRRAIIPQHEIAYSPLVPPGELFTGGDGPQLVEQRFGLRQRQPLNIGIPPSSQIKCSPLGFRMCANQRMPGARRRH